VVAVMADTRGPDPAVRRGRWSRLLASGAVSAGVTGSGVCWRRDRGLRAVGSRRWSARSTGFMGSTKVLYVGPCAHSARPGVVHGGGGARPGTSRIQA